MSLDQILKKINDKKIKSEICFFNERLWIIAVKRFIENRTYESIGHDYGLSKQRIFVICKQFVKIINRL